ncbi:anti-sigma factor family protein [Bacteroidota bacterium]
MNQEHPAEILLQQYVDGSFFSNRGKIKQHLKICETCRRQVETYQVLDEYLKTDPNEKFSDYFEDRIIAVLRKREIEPVINKPYLLSALFFLIGIICYLFLLPETREILFSSFNLTWEAISDTNSIFIKGNNFLSNSLYIIFFSLIVIATLGIPSWKYVINSLSGNKK